MHSNRITALFLIVSFLFIGASSVSPVEDGFPLEGDWKGTLVTPQGELPVIFHIKKTEDDSFTATIDSPAQEAFDIPMDSVELKDHTVRIWSEALQGGFTAELDDEKLDEMSGTWDQMGNTLPLTLSRVKGDSQTD